MKKELQPYHVLYLGESGFPKGLAAMQRLILISKALLENGIKVTILNRKGLWDPDKPVHMESSGQFEGIHYHYTSGSVYRPKKFLARNWLKVKSLVNEVAYLRRLKRNEHLDAAIISTHSFLQGVLFLIYGYVFRFPVVLNYVELASARQDDDQSFSDFINDYLFDHLLVKKMNAALPISEVLLKNFNQVAPGRPAFKIPVICDFQKFQLPKDLNRPPYFLYCGSIGYRRVIDFILDAYDQITSESLVYDLYLVASNGSKSEYESLQKKIDGLQPGRNVKVFANIPYDQLVDLYINAKALLIPLRPTPADEARFPHKIGEYTASGNPIITTNFGEISNYFKDEETALIADSYKVDTFAKKMKFVLDYPDEARKIGERGHLVGQKEFDYISHSSKLGAFFKNLNRQL